MRVAWFTPVRDGAIAQYSRGVLAAMVRLCEVRLFCDGPPDRFPAGVPVVDLAAQPEALSELHRFDAVFYNLGNDFRQHAWIFDVARLHPGIVVLHDLTLHRFFLDYYLRHLCRPDVYVTRMAEHYGIGGLTTAHRALGPWFDPEGARVDDDGLRRYPFTEEALRAANGAVVHSRWHGAVVRQRWGGPVCEAWLPAQRSTAASTPAETPGGKIGEKRITLMTLGPVEPRSHVADVIGLLAVDPDLAARTRYLIAGRLDPADPYVRELTAAIAESSLARSVRMLGQLRPVELDHCARAADLFINLHHPDDQGCSGSLMYQLTFGKPVIVYDSGSFAEVPNETVAKIAIGDRAGLQRTLRELVRSAARRQAIGTAAKRFADGHGPRDYARAILRFAKQDASPRAADWLARDGSRAVVERIAIHVGETLASLGVEPSSPEVEAVIRETGNLLWPAPRGSRHVTRAYAPARSVPLAAKPL